MNELDDEDIPTKCAVCNCRDSFIEIGNVIKCDVCGSEFIKQEDKHEKETRE